MTTTDERAVGDQSMRRDLFWPMLIVTGVLTIAEAATVVYAYAPLIPLAVGSAFAILLSVVVRNETRVWPWVGIHAALTLSITIMATLVLALALGGY